LSFNTILLNQCIILTICVNILQIILQRGKKTSRWSERKKKFFLWQLVSFTCMPETTCLETLNTWALFLLFCNLAKHFLARLFFFQKSRGIVIVRSALPLPLPSENLYLDHNFFISWCIVFILGHNNPWDKTTLTLTFIHKWHWPSRLKVQFLLVHAVIGCNFVIFEWIVFKLEHNNLQGYPLKITLQTLTFTHKWPWLWRSNYWNFHFFGYYWL
jgi:hypothetical protein